MLTILRTSRQLRQYTGDVKGAAALVVVGAALGGMAQAAALFLAVRVALLNTTTTETDVELPVVGFSLSPNQSLMVATALGLASVVTNVTVASFSSKVARAVLENARAITIRRYLNASWETQSRQREGAAQEAVTTLSQRSALLAHGIAMAAAQTATIVVFVGAALLIDPVSAGATAVAGGLLALGLRPVARATKLRSRSMVMANSHYAEEVSRITKDTLELRAFGTTEAAEHVLAEVSRDVADKFYRSRFMTLLGSALFKDVAIILLIGCAAVLLRAETDNFSNTGAVAVLSLRALAAAQQLNTALQNVTENSANLEQLNERNATLLTHERVTGTRTAESIGDLVISHASFHHEDSTAGIKDVTFTVKRGEAVALVGASGSGKSTLLTLILGIRHPSEGSIEADGIDLSVLSPGSWTKLCAYVPQEPTLLNASVLDNIRFYRDFSEMDVEQAALDANVLAELQQLPDGLHTMLGPRGTGLSGGQKQRVAIARALVGQPSLLILDEPSSALDVESERLLNASLAALRGRTSILVATHKLGTLDICDRVVVLRDGKLETEGKPSEVAVEEILNPLNSEGGP